MCNGSYVFVCVVVFLWWCLGGVVFVVVFLWWCLGGDIFVGCFYGGIFVAMKIFL